MGGMSPRCKIPVSFLASVWWRKLLSCFCVYSGSHWTLFWAAPWLVIAPSKVAVSVPVRERGNVAGSRYDSSPILQKPFFEANFARKDTPYSRGVPAKKCERTWGSGGGTFWRVNSKPLVLLPRVGAGYLVGGLLCGNLLAAGLSF